MITLKLKDENDTRFGIAPGVSLLLAVRSQRQRQLSVVAWNNVFHWQEVGAVHLAELGDIRSHTQYVEAARITIDPNDLPF